jgi:hypothetical protein
MRKILQATIAEIEHQLEQLSALADQTEVREAVSGWSPVEHVDHCLKVCSSVLRGIVDPRQPLPSGVNLLGRAVLIIGRFPRGRGKSPQSLRGTRATREQIEMAMAEVRRHLRTVTEPDFRAAEGPIIRHPYFGGLNATDAFRFLTIHNRHHLRIIADIVATAPREDG